METDPSDSCEETTPEIRTRLLRAFEVWLDTVLATEPPPQGLAAEFMKALETGEPLPPVESRCDLYSLWSSMTVLTQEVKLQSRTFKQLSDTMAEIQASSRSEESDLAASSSAEAAEAARGEIERRIRQEQVDLLLDLRDRLSRGSRSICDADAKLADVGRQSIFARWLGSGRSQQVKATMAALSEGYILTLDRLEQALLDYRLTPIACDGQPFDPHRMTAVEIEETEAVPEGTVVGIYRSGYEWDGELYRSAQVKVARAPREQKKR